MKVCYSKGLIYKAGFFHTSGDDRIRQRDTGCGSLRLGMAEVPVPCSRACTYCGAYPLLHSIDAKNASSKLVAYAEGVVAGLSLRGALAPA